MRCAKNVVGGKRNALDCWFVTLEWIGWEIKLLNESFEDMRCMGVGCQWYSFCVCDSCCSILTGLGVVDRGIGV